VVPPGIRAGQRSLLYLSGQSIYFVRITATAVYPLYKSLFTLITSANRTNAVSTGQDPTVTAGLITAGVVVLLAMLLATPPFLQRRMNKDVDQWAVIDYRKRGEPEPDVCWRVRLPNIFRTTCDIHIPVPPRKRSISLEAGLERDRMAATDEKGRVALSRVDSIASQRSMFED